MPNASVCVPSTSVLSSRPALNASTIGGHPVDCTATSRGSLEPIQPSSCISFIALWMPISPTPPPAG